MIQDKIDEFKDDYALLVEAGFVAVKQLDEINSTRLFCAAQLLDIHGTAPRVGLGYVALNKLDTKKAMGYFEDVLSVEPNNDLAQSFLGICYALLKKHKKGEEMIKSVINKTDDPTIKNLGTISLEWIEKDLNKKNKAPFFNEPTKE